VEGKICATSQNKNVKIKIAFYYSKNSENITYSISLRKESGTVREWGPTNLFYRKFRIGLRLTK